MLVVRAKLTSSPCIKICSLENGYCIGCGRSQDEIREWFIATDERKKEIKERIARDGIPNRMP